MNKKGNWTVNIIMTILVILMIAIVIGVTAFIKSFFLNAGTSIDYPYTIEKQSFFGWSKLWLKDDHTTVYCFDDNKIRDTIQSAMNNKQKIQVTYQEYVWRGFFCSSGNDRINSVVITGVSIVPNTDGGIK